jgi:23S rRNA-/tRNA-specific pseudouridylate synthase
LGHPKKQVINAPLFTGFDKKSWRSKVFVNADQWKASRSEILDVQRFEDRDIGKYSLIRVKITTWRMHQIRVHCTSIGHPIIGDLTYGIPAVNRLAKKHFGVIRQLLHSYTYAFEDTIQWVEQSFTAPLPDQFLGLTTR